MHANQRDGGDGICAGRGRILEGFAAHFETTHRRGIGGAIEETADFGVAVKFDGEIHGALRFVKIARLQGGLVSIQQRDHAEYLVVERAFERGAADAMAEAARFAPYFCQHAIERF